MAGLPYYAHANQFFVQKGDVLAPKAKRLTNLRCRPFRSSAFSLFPLVTQRSDGYRSLDGEEFQQPTSEKRNLIIIFAHLERITLIVNQLKQWFITGGPRLPPGDVNR